MPQEKSSPVAPAIGSIIGGKYKLLQRIGSGGGGEVWKADDLKNNTVALKFLMWAPKQSRAVATERFKNEFAILKSLSHPNIAQIYDFGLDSHTGRYFFTTELLIAGNLKEMMGMPLPVMEALLLQGLRALEYLRCNKLLHLDIKPSNFLLRHDGVNPTLVLIDFGMATFRSSHIVGGTSNYMPPEVVVKRLKLTGEIGRYPPPDHRSDLYSLGVTFYYCLTGMRPFHANAADGRSSVDATMMRHLDFFPQPPSFYQKEIPPYLDQIIMKLMANHPDDRYPSAIVAAQALQYRSPTHHEPESRQTLLAYLPKEGKLVGRHTESATVEEILKEIADGIPHAVPIICIAGGRGTGRSRLLKAAKPIAQQLEMNTVLIELGQESRDDVLGAIESAKVSEKAFALLIDDLDLKIGDLTEELKLLVKRLKLQQRLAISTGQQMCLIFTINTDKLNLKEALSLLELDETVCQTIFLKNFSNTEMTEYLTTLLGETPDTSVVRQLKKCTDGNPLFITEHLEEMIAKGRLFSLAGRPDAKTLKAIGIDFSEIPPPRTLSDIVSERIALLPNDAKNLALIMACWQRPVNADELKETGGMDVDRNLMLLVGAEIIRKDSANGRFLFASDLTARIIRSGTNKHLVENCHNSIAKFLKKTTNGKSRELDLHVAYGGHSQESVDALGRLSRRALDEQKPIEAARHLERLLQLLPHTDMNSRANVLAELGKAYEKARHYDDARDTYRKLAFLKGSLDLCTQFRIRAAEQLGLLAMRRRELKLARRFFSDALNLVTNEPSMLPWKLRIENFLAGVDLREGKIEDAVQRFERTAKIAGRNPPAKTLAITNNELGEALLRSGHVKKALAILRKELTLAARAKDEERMAVRHCLIGDALRHDTIRRYKEAEDNYQKALKHARAQQMVELCVRILNGLGNLNLMTSRPEKALAHYRDALKLAEQIEGETTSVELMIGMGLASQKMGKLGNAIEYFEAALDFSSGPRGTQAGLIRRYRPTIFVSLGDAYYQKRDLEHAEQYLKEALALDKKHPFTPDIRYSLYGTYVEVFLAKGEVDAAKYYLPTLEEIAKSFPPAKGHFKELSRKILIRETF